MFSICLYSLASIQWLTSMKQKLIYVFTYFRLDPEDRLWSGWRQPQLWGQDGEEGGGGGEESQGETADGGGEVTLSDIDDCFWPLIVLYRAMWRQKKAEEAELLFRDIEEVKEFARQKMFGK